MTPSCGL